MLVRLAHAHPCSSQAELALVFHAETGIAAHPDTFAKALKLAGITRVKQRAKGSFQSPEPNKSYGYNESHRRQLPEQLYPSCLTDTEWALVADLFESQGGRGVPPLHSRRTLLEALCYVVHARGTHGECYPAIFLIRTMFTRPCAGGALKANASKCMIACGLNGASGKNALTARQRLS